VANNNYPQITSVTSEVLQAQIRNLLPSQEGFGTDLMAQNVIVPIIDLTAAAEGSTVPENLQTAVAFGSQTAFSAVNGTDVIANTTGFWRISGVASIKAAATNHVLQISGSDGLSTKIYMEWRSFSHNETSANQTIFDFVVFLAAGESVSAVSNNANATLIGSSRQIADINGTLVNPSGFNPQ
jgi:hypothetical protein